MNKKVTIMISGLVSITLLASLGFGVVYIIQKNDSSKVEEPGKPPEEPII